jgi:hypothetical protein
MLARDTVTMDPRQKNLAARREARMNLLRNPAKG